MNKMAQIREQKIGTNEVGIWWIGQAGYIVKTSKKIICIDPYLSDSARQISEDFARMVPAPILSEELACDLFLCTHNHLDHADPVTIKGIRNKDAITFIGPRTTFETFLQSGVKKNSFVRLDVGEEKEFSGIKIKGTFCIPNEEAVLDSEGFILFLDNNINLYFTGDTDYTRFLEYVADYQIDIMFTCINGKYGNMNINDSIKLVEKIKPKIVVPNHYGMFACNDADPYEFKSKAPHLNSLILNLGEPYLYRKDKGLLNNP